MLQYRGHTFPRVYSLSHGQSRHPGFPPARVFSLGLSPLLFYRREPPQRFGNGLRQGSKVVIGRKQIPKPRRRALLELFDPVIVWWPSLMTMTVHGFPSRVDHGCNLPECRQNLSNYLPEIVFVPEFHMLRALYRRTSWTRAVT